ncbi:hypothetical protein LJR027_001803 [Terrabacter sp. LjRoot27]|uniref:hypothetical protein n=1 Tax=Terrabacter sp. LjRoot27 TaxID=3342306 RepID=UPI003ECC2A54
MDGLLEQARERLSLRAGGAPLCSTAPPSGTPGHGETLKSFEGAVVALSRLRTSVLQEPAEPAGTLAERCIRAWRSENEHRHGSAWADYTDGGARALGDALGKLEHVEPVSDDAPHPFSSPRSPVAPHPLASSTSTPRRWSPRRAVVASTLVAALSTGLVVRSAQTPQASAWATAIGLAALVLASSALSTFVPAQGRLSRLHLGCGPCAAAGGLLALGATWLTIADPGVLGSATLSFGAAGFALTQRLTAPPSCPTAVPPRRTGQPSDTDSTHPTGRP